MLEESRGFVFFVTTPADEVMVVAFLLLVLSVPMEDPTVAAALAVATALRAVGVFLGKYLPAVLVPMAFEPDEGRVKEEPLFDGAVLLVPVPNRALIDRSGLLLVERLPAPPLPPPVALVFLVALLRSEALLLLLMPAEANATMGLRASMPMVDSSKAARFGLAVVVLRAPTARMGLVV